MSTRRNLLLVLVVGWSAGLSDLQAQEAKGDPLQSLNSATRAAYKQARAAILTKNRPVILYDQEKLVLLRDKERLEAKLDLTRYHNLKAVAHAPMGLYLLLKPQGDGKLSAERIEQLLQFREAIVRAGKSLDKYFKGDELNAQHEILLRTLAFLDTVLKNEEFEAREATEFARSMEPLIQANMVEATHSLIDALHKQMQAWRKVLTVDEWTRLRIIIQGSPMPRKNNVAIQYFARWFGEQGEGKRVIYAESLWEEDRAVNLLGTHLLDTDIGQAFFNDPRRMHRDLLGDAATQYLWKLKFE